MSEETVSISSEFDVFARKPIETAVLETFETVYKPIAAVEQSYFEFLIPGDLDTYIELYIKVYVGGKLISVEGKDLDAKDFTAITNNFLHSIQSM